MAEAEFVICRSVSISSWAWACIVTVRR